MNRIYKVIWSKIRNCYVAVSEMAKNHGKGSVRSEARGVAKGTSALALCIALSLGVTGNVWADDFSVEGDLTVTGSTQTKSLDVTDGTITIGSNGTITVDANHNSLFGESNTLENRPRYTNFYDTLLGNTNRIFYGNYSTAIGNSNTINGYVNGNSGSAANYSTAIGSSNNVNGSNHTAIGSNNNIINDGSSSYYGISNSTAIGSSNNVYGAQNIAIGSNNDIRGKDNVNTNNNVAIGQGAHIIGESYGSNIAIGSSAYITDYYLSNGSPTTATSFGDNYWSVQSPIRDSIAMGASSYALSSRVTAVGNFTRVVGPNSSAFGYGAQIYGQRNNTAIGNYSLAGFPYAKKYDDQTGRYVKDSLYGADNTAVGSYSMAGSGYNNVAIGARSRAGYWSQVSYDERMAALQASAMEQYGDYDGVMNEVQRRAGEIIDAQINGNPPEGYDEWSEEQKDSYRNWQMNQYLYSSPSHVNMYDGNTPEDTGGSRIINDILFEQWLKMKNNNQIQSDDYSTAVGVEASAEGVGQTAIGGHAQALGWSSMAVGLGSKSTGASSMAIGESSLASGDASTAIGNTSESRGYKTLAIGPQTKAFGDESIAIGLGNYDNTQTWGYRATAIGINAHADTSSAIAIGDGAKIDYDEAGAGILQRRVAMNAIAVGQNARAAALDGTAVGRNTKAIMRNATAYGNNAHANAWNSIAIGNKAIAGLAENIYEEKVDDYDNVTGYEVYPTVKVTDDDGLEYVTKGAEYGDSAVAIGNRAKAKKEYTTAVGAGTNAEGWHAVAVGDSNQATGKFSTAIGAGWSENYTPGEENDDGTSADKDSVNTEKDPVYTAMGANQAFGDYSTSVGYMNQTVGTQSTALGKDNAISGLSSLGIGAGNEVGAVDKGDNGVLSADQENTVSGYAVGSYNTITGTEESNAGAFGASNKVTGDNSYAIGNSNTVSGATSLAFGTGNIITGNRAGAFGDPNTIDGDDSYAVGNNNNIAADAKRSFILGHEATASVADAVALGSTSVAKRTIHNGGGEKDLTNTGFDVTTGTNYAGEDKEKPTWLSTLGAVSVGGTADDTDAKIGTAATQTRQITGVAAGTADTDAVNVAQLKLAVGAGGPANIDTDNRNVSLVNDEENKKQVITSPYIHVDGVKDAALDTYAKADGTNSIAIGYKSQANVVDSVALGSNSVASRAAKNGGAGAGYDVTTGTYYKGENATSPTWTSTLGAISVGGDSADGSIGAAATVTRQITGVAAGTADTDAVNVAQLKVIRTHYYSVNTEKVGDGDSGDVYNADDSNYDNQGATGKGALAAGYYTSATGNESTALGNKSLAKGEKSVATGYKASASGPSSTAYGVQSTAAGEESVAVGLNAHAYGLNSSAMGIAAKAVGDGGLAIGHGSSTDVKAKVVESGAEGTAERANGLWTTEVDITNDGKAPATGGIAIGSYAHTEGTRALAVGRVASAYGENSTAIGLRSSAYGEGSIAFGHGVEAGDKDHPYNEQVSALHNDPSIPYDLDGEEVTLKNGEKVKVDPKNVIGAVAMGSYAKATGRGSLSVGRYSEANSAYSTAMGIRANVDNTATNAIAIGREVTVGKGGENSVAIGKQSTVSGKDSIAIGTGHTITGSNSGAFGDPSYIDADSAYAIGNNNTIETASKESFVVGNNVKTTKENTVVVGTHTKDNTHAFGANSTSLGFDAVAEKDNSVALGSDSVADRGTSTGGFNVATGKKDYTDGTSTWESTHAAVSVGTTDGKVTRQITGVAAGTEDTDAVNVAQLKLAMGAKNYTQGNNVTIDENNVINAQDTTYQFNTVDGDPDTNVVSTTTVNSSTDGTNYDTKVGEFKDTDTKITNVTVNAGKKDNTGNTPYTITLNDNGDNKAGASKLTATFNVQDTTYTTNQSVEAGTDWKDGKGGSTTFTITDSSGNDLKPMTIKAGDNVKITEGPNGAAVIEGNGLVAGEYPVVYDEKTGEGSVTIKDEAGHEAKITNIKAGGGEGVADSINYLGNRINNLDNKINKVGAGAAALAGLHPLDFDPDEKWHVAAGVGSYYNETAVALGAFYQPTDDVLFNVATTLGDGRNMVSGGVSIRFGQKSHQSRSKKAMAKEIIELREEVAELKALVYDLTGKGGLDPSKTAVFPDTPENHWAYDYVAVLAGNGVLEGYQDGYFKGNRQLTRYEMAAIIYRLMSKGIEVDNRMLQEFAPELARVKVDTLTHYGDGTPHIQRVRIIPQRG